MRELISIEPVANPTEVFMAYGGERRIILYKSSSSIFHILHKPQQFCNICKNIFSKERKMENGARQIKIFDTTLRDGEQSPGCSMNAQEKLEVAKQLERLRVDVIEAGFPASSPGDLESVKSIAGIVQNSTIAGLCRSLEKDIDAGWQALSRAANPRIHVFLATSPIHMEYKLKMTADQVLEQAVSAVKYAKKYCSDVEFSAEDAFRSDPDFVCKVFGAVIAAGATTVNAPDTVGYAMPDEFGVFIRYLKEHTNGIEKAALSTHVHNDLGLGVASSLAAIKAGADQIECTINGIGERAGNASLEEIVMALRVRKDYWHADTRIDTTQLYPTSRLITRVTGVKVQPNKAIVGENAFAHEAGIHQHGVLAKRETYEIMTPESIGLQKNQMVLGKHSGKHALEDRLKELGITVTAQDLERIFTEFKILADKKKSVSDRDIEALARGIAASVPETWKLLHWVVDSSSALGATGAIQLQHKDGSFHKQAALASGPIDVAFKVIDKIIGKDISLESFEIGAITEGEDALGETCVKIKHGERTWNGHGISIDIVESAIMAYIAAINAMEWELDAGRGKSSVRAA
jgi:2-isopropylmalate synthase